MNCKTCRHWDRSAMSSQPTQYNECMRTATEDGIALVKVERPEQALAYGGLGQGVLVTAATFGCVEYEESEDWRGESRRAQLRRLSMEDTLVSPREDWVSTRFTMGEAGNADRCV